MIDVFQFADGTSVTSADMAAAAKGINGTSSNDVLTGSALNDKIYGLSGNDTLTGGAGNDLLVGGVGSDLYKLGRGAGQDIIDNSTADTTPGKQDIVQYSADVASNQLWFQHVGSDLVVSIIGTTDKVNIQNWYSSTANHVQEFIAGDGKTLSDSQVDQLVNAMAGFAPPPQGQTTLPQSYQDQLAPTLAASWQ
ncbi:uncharacterized protein NMK_2420 [Novimethylophilus kurashikiensis]|uniref:Haemolysin-type calcium binding-related domain-containing protein n=2 Tax=Novimethylophilus kurashikiensis TaxID=1825523 RepID=A0A2R5FAH3_9PROT|nr:uncharacterized protein NMK_2420 [Novimethylophilus kurashikiensis]